MPSLEAARRPTAKLSHRRLPQRFQRDGEWREDSDGFPRSPLVRFRASRRTSLAVFFYLDCFWAVLAICYADKRSALYADKIIVGTTAYELTLSIVQLTVIPGISALIVTGHRERLTTTNTEKSFGTLRLSVNNLPIVRHWRSKHLSSVGRHSLSGCHPSPPN